VEAEMFYISLPVCYHGFVSIARLRNMPGGVSAAGNIAEQFFEREKQR
jgi:hypothetical protein